MRLGTSALAVVVCAAVLAGSTMTLAQGVAVPGEAELHQLQADLFDRMYADPDDLDLMFEYATVSIRLRDYEAAISTLERMLIYNPDLPRVRLELAVAYFNVGAYEVARLYFEQVLADPATPETVGQRVATFMDEIERRTARSALSVVANLGLTYSTNANLGPISDDVVVGGVPGFVLDPESRSQDDVGVRFLVYGTHALDLRQPTGEALITNFSLFGLRYFDVSDGDTIFARVRSGPRLGVGDGQPGPTIRPYVEAEYLNGADRTIYAAGYGGVEFLHPLGEGWSAFADIGAGFLDFEQRRNAEDRLSVRFQGGAIYAPTRDFAFRAAGLLRFDEAEEDFNSNLELGTTLSGEYSYASGIGLVDRKWTLSAYVDARYRTYDSPDPFIDPEETRREVDFRGGISHLFAIRDGFGLLLDVEGLVRRSNIRNFELDNVSVTLSAQYRF